MAKSTKNAPRTTAGRTEKPTSNQPDMKTSEIRDLIDFISQSGLNEVNIETRELKLHVKREPDQKVFKSTPVQMAASLPAAAPVAQAAAPAKVEKPVAAGNKTVDIKSPMIGTFYRTSNPDSPPFVSVGDKITKGQTVCIIEALNLFNELDSEVSGTLVKAMVVDSSPV